MLIQSPKRDIYNLHFRATNPSKNNHCKITSASQVQVWFLKKGKKSLKIQEVVGDCCMTFVLCLVWQLTSTLVKHHHHLLFKASFLHSPIIAALSHLIWGYNHVKNVCCDSFKTWGDYVDTCLLNFSSWNIPTILFSILLYF